MPPPPVTAKGGFLTLEELVVFPYLVKLAMICFPFHLDEVPPDFICQLTLDTHQGVAFEYAKVFVAFPKVNPLACGKLFLEPYIVPVNIYQVFQLGGLFAVVIDAGAVDTEPNWGLELLAAYQ